jgi:hypothetical protein
MNAFEAVRILRARQNAILEALPSELRAEYLEIESAIRHIDTLIVANGARMEIPADFNPRLRQLLAGGASEQDRPNRVSLTQRRLALREYLASFGPAPRGQILRHTRIPPGTLSALLTEDEFERSEDGLWRLRETG